MTLYQLAIPKEHVPDALRALTVHPKYKHGLVDRDGSLEDFGVSPETIGIFLARDEILEILEECRFPYVALDLMTNKEIRGKLNRRFGYD